MRDVLAGEAMLRRMEWTMAVLLAAATTGTWFIYSGRAALGVFLGGAIVTVSFQVLKWQLKRAFRGAVTLPSKSGLFVTYYLRLIGTFFVVFLVMYFGWADPIAFLTGLSIVVASIFMVGGLEFLVLLAKKGES